MTDLVSIIVPLFNSELYLNDCVQSILSQDYPNWELILIDDGSTDNSGSICRNFTAKDHRIKYVRCENKGPSHARNLGLDMIQGEYVMFVDSDDQLLPEAISVLLKTQKKYNADYVEGNIRESSIRNKISPSESKIIIYSKTEALDNLLYQKKLLSSPWAKLYKRSLFKEIRFREGIIYEDLQLIYRIIYNSEIVVYIDYPVYFYRKHSGSLINTWNKERLAVLDVTAEIEKSVSNEYPLQIAAARDRRLSANFNMFALCEIHKDRYKSEQCWKLIKRYRKYSLFNPKVRIKNKAGILLSYFGKNIFRFIAGMVYK